MNNGKRFKGVVVPMVTPFRDNGNIDEPAAVRITEYLMESGTIPFVLGTTGELASIPLQQRVKLVKTVVTAAAGKTSVFAGISDCVFSKSVELAKKYFDLGVEVCVAHVPYYYPLTSDLLRRYFENLADAIPGYLMLYNIPITTRISVPLDIIEALSYHPKIVGLKDSERDENRLKQSAQIWQKRSDFCIFCGWNSQMSYALAAGFDGIVPSTANIIPMKYRLLYDATLNNDIDTYKRLQHETDMISKIYQNNRILSQSVPALKILMSYLQLCKPNVLPPLHLLGDMETREIVDAFSKCILEI